MPQITLYHVKGACSLVPHALLLHLGIPFESVEMVFRAGDDGLEAADGSLSNAAYRAINPAGYVPVLVVDGALVTEQFAVLTMIALLAADRGAGEALLGGSSSDPMNRVRVVEWVTWLSDTLHSHGYGAFLHPQRFVEGRRDMYDVVRAKGLKTIEHAYALIEERVEGRDWAVGDRVTVVDFFLYVFWNWGRKLARIDMGARYPAYGKLLRRVEAFEGVRKAMEEEGQDLYFE